MCDVPLGPYLVMVIVRIVCAYPRASTLSRSAPYDRADPLEPAPAAYFWLTISPPRPDRRNPDAVRAALAQSRHVGTLAIDHRVRRVADLISIYSVVVFVLGNWWVITSTSCAADSPTLYRGAVAALVFSWLYVAEILVWATLVIFFLPFVLVRRLSLGPASTASSRCSQADDRPVVQIGARWFGLGQKKNEVGPLKKEDIASLPQRVFMCVTPHSLLHSSSPSASR